MTNDITILSCPQCGFPEIRDCGNGLYQCDDCGTHFDKNENIVLTEQEYLQTCNTEQLAEFLADELNYVVERVLEGVWLNDGDTDRDEYYQRKSDVLEWLKQPHTPKE